MQSVENECPKCGLADHPHQTCSEADAAELLNNISTATWRPSSSGTRVSIGLLAKPSRKMRKAMNNRRWEKKACKTISALTGIPLVAIQKRGELR